MHRAFGLLLIGCGGVAADTHDPPGHTDVPVPSDTATADRFAPTDLGPRPFTRLPLPPGTFVPLEKPAPPGEDHPFRVPSSTAAPCPVAPDGTVLFVVNGAVRGDDGVTSVGPLWRYGAGGLVAAGALGETALDGGPPVLAATDTPLGLGCVDLDPSDDRVEVQVRRRERLLVALAEVGPTSWAAAEVPIPAPDLPEELRERGLPLCDTSCGVGDLDGNGLPDLIAETISGVQRAGWPPFAVALQTAPGVWAAPAALGVPVGVQQNAYVVQALTEHPLARAPGRARWWIAALGKIEEGNPPGLWFEAEAGARVFAAVDPTPVGARFEVDALPGLVSPGPPLGFPLTAVNPMGTAVVQLAAGTPGAHPTPGFALTTIGGEVALLGLGPWAAPGGWPDWGSRDLVLPRVRTHAQALDPDQAATPWAGLAVDLDGDADDDLLVSFGDDDGSFRACGLPGAFCEPEGGREPVGLLALENVGARPHSGLPRFRAWPDAAIGDLAIPENRRPCVLTDLDADGDPDVVCGGYNRPEVFRNEVPGRFVSFRVRGAGVVDDHLGTGAWVEIETPDGQAQLKPVGASASPVGMAEPLVFFGLGDQDRADRVRVWWASGAVSTFEDGYPAGALHELRQAPPARGTRGAW